MAKNYVQDGNTVRFTATAAMKSGDVAMIENLAVVAESDIAQAGVGVGLTTGVFTVKAKASDDTAGSNKRLGVAWRASGASVDTVDVKINA